MKPIQQKQKAGIVMSLNDMILTKVTYTCTENTPLGSRMKWRLESTSGLVPSKTLSSIYCNKTVQVYSWGKGNIILSSYMSISSWIINFDMNSEESCSFCIVLQA